MKIRKRFLKYQIKDLKLMRKLMLVGLCMVLLVGIVSYVQGVTYSLCYQESANVSTICGGLDTGIYGCEGSWDATQSCSLIIDESWDTYGWADSGAPSYAYLYINYTKPLGAEDSSLWQVKDNVGIVNLTINSTCWLQTPLQLRVWGEYDSDEAHWECRNDTDWIEMRGAVFGFNQLYEEAMIWNISDAPPPPPPTINITSISKTSMLTINKGGMLTISK